MFDAIGEAISSVIGKIALQNHRGDRRRNDQGHYSGPDRRYHQERLIIHFSLRILERGNRPVLLGDKVHCKRWALFFLYPLLKFIQLFRRL